MRLFPEKYRVLACVALLLAAGFLATCIAAYMVSRDVVQRGIAGQALPLAGDVLAAEIRSHVTRPALIASAMAGDTFVRDWMEAGELDTDTIVRYLAGIQREHGAVGAFLISARTRSHYTPQGLLKSVQDNEIGDSWYFRARDMKQAFEAEVEIDRANGNEMTVYINHRMVDGQGNFLGAAGIAVRVAGLTALIDSHEKHAGRRIYVVDGRRKVVLAGTSSPVANRSIDQLPGIGSITGRLLGGGDQPVLLDYEHDGTRFFASGRAIPELGWHLIVEQNAAADMQPARNAFVPILAIGAGVTLLVLVLILLTVNRYGKQLELMAGTDMLTGLLSRQAFEIVYRQAMLEVERSPRPLSCILFDIDFFKHVNDSCGHLIGDEVLRTISLISRAMLRESDVMARWGGEEFIVLLKDCPLEQAVAVAEKLRHAVDRHDFLPIVSEHPVTISLGVAQHELGETAMLFLQRADEALVKAKANGRNRLQVARTEGSAAGEVVQEGPLPGGRGQEQGVDQ